MIRTANASDALAIARIQVTAWRAAYAGLMPATVLDALSVEGRTSVWARLIATPATTEHRMWVIESESTPVGFASTGPSRDEGATAATMEIYAIYLAPDYVGRGLGQALHAHAIADFARRGAHAVTLWALEGNLRATRFYERMGMHRDGEKVETVEGARLRHIRYRVDLR